MQRAWSGVKQAVFQVGFCRSTMFYTLLATHVNKNVNDESPDAKETYSWLSSAKRWGGIACSEIMLLIGVVWSVKSRGSKTDP